MRFGNKFNSVKIPEWTNAYLNYKLLKKILVPFKLISKTFI